MITTRSRYGLRLLIELADRAGSAPIDLGSVARNQDIPELYLSKLAATLKAAGVLRSERGAKGGYRLARRPEDISILSVVEALEGRSSLLECTDDPAICARSGECRTLPVWSGLDKAINDYLRGVSLADAAVAVIDYSI